MSERGMKKWAPYKALVEQEEVINRKIDLENNVERPELSEDKQEQINNILINYHGETRIITYYINKRIIKEETTIKKIDIYEKKLILSNRRAIPFIDLIDIN